MPNIIIIAYFEEKYNIPTDYCFVAVLRCYLGTYFKYSAEYYTSIQITPGQTLNDSAGIYMTDDYKDTSAYIEEVCMINHIFPDDIHEGEYLTVPYYSAEYLK